MTRDEWILIAAYMSAAVGRDFGDAQAEVYFDLLGDLDGQLVKAAAQTVLARSPYPTLPTPGAIRVAAIGLQGDPLTAVEAWGIARKAVGRFGLSRESDALASMPPAVARAVQAIGWRAMCDARLDDLDTLRAHFLRGFEAIALRESNQTLLPASVKNLLVGIGTEAAPAAMDNRSGLEILKAIPRRKDP